MQVARNAKFNATRTLPSSRLCCWALTRRLWRAATSRCGAVGKEAKKFSAMMRVESFLAAFLTSLLPYRNLFINPPKNILEMTAATNNLLGIKQQTT